MTEKKKEYPYCFGKLDTVFPLGKDSLRHTPESCMVCFCKTECLRAAIKGPEGVKVEEERVTLWNYIIFGWARISKALRMLATSNAQ
jgi:hypothetical protein